MTSTELDPKHAALLDDFRARRRAALSRIISIVEDQRPGFRGLLNALHQGIGHAHRIGVTGPPGAGKSTLTAGLIARYRERGETVAVIAVDPTSPFTGGALLGDRIRMNEISMDAGVFIRSMATRGSLGGLALATKEVADVMDAFGFDRIIVETVGVGQSELDIAAAADTTVVVLVPESGDGIQAMKAGLMEAADLFVINKADRSGADRLAREVSMMLHLRSGSTLRNVPAHHGVDLRRVRVRDASGARTGSRTACGVGRGCGRAGWGPGRGTRRLGDPRAQDHGGDGGGRAGAGGGAGRPPCVARPERRAVHPPPAAPGRARPGGGRPCPAHHGLGGAGRRRGAGPALPDLEAGTGYAVRRGRAHRHRRNDA
jgi:LAO/AO transport system ATPase